MKLPSINIAINQSRPMYRVYLAAGEIITGRIIEVHNEYILMRYIHHPELTDLRIIVDTDHIAAIEEFE